MSRGDVTFLGSGAKGPPLLQPITFITGALDPTIPEQFVALPPARQTRDALEEAMAAALRAGGGYPEVEAAAHLGALGWIHGYDGILNPSHPGGGVDRIRVTVSEESSFVLPELAPYEEAGKTGTWLDRRQPIYRTVHKAGRAPRPHPPDSLAILHQSDPLFDELAESLHATLCGRGFRADCYPGAQVASQRGRVLGKILHEYRAVVFLGHHQRPEADRSGGWRLTDTEALSMEDLASFLGVHLQPSGYTLAPGWRLGRVPELVLAGCCCGAWGDGIAARGHFYPQLFLAAGVRSFVGSWMDVFVPPDELVIYRRFLEEFLSRFCEAPAAAVDHLYRAKQECDFHLLTSLFQIYTSPPASGEPIVEAAADSREMTSHGALLSSLTAGDRLGDYVLKEERWADEYARTFSAEGPDGSLLIQVPADEWQADEARAEELETAVGRLASVGAAEGHLTPSRLESLPWVREGETLRSVLALVYEGAPAGLALLDQATFDVRAEGHVERVMRWGAQVAAALAHLHELGFAHGNLSEKTVVLTEGGRGALLRDSWVSQLGSGRFAPEGYDDPDSSDDREPDSRMRDTFGLGVLLYQAVAGKPPFREDEPRDRGLRVPLRDAVETAGGHAAAVPEAFEHIVRDCLAPSARLRAGADVVARRLRLALWGGGVDFTGELHLAIQAGHRLFAVLTDDIDELEGALVGLSTRRRPPALSGGPAIRYHLLVGVEDVGLEAIGSGGRREVLVPWVAGAAPEENAGNLFMRIWEFCGALPPGEIGIVLLRGYDWWELGLLSSRFFRLAQAGGASSPVILTADRFVSLESEVSGLFRVLPWPGLAPSVTFERILRYRDDVEPDTAVELASELSPTNSRELMDLLRMAELEFGVIDTRLLGLREEERFRRLRDTGTASYTPASRLPDPAHLGLPGRLREELSVWVRQMERRRIDPEESIVARRLLIEGPSGWGKTTLAKTLGALIRHPLVTVDAAGCLRGRLGESEAALDHTLRVVGSLGRVLVLVDNVDELFVDAPQNPRAGLAGTLGRLSSALLQWLDHLPDEAVAVLTARRPERLEPPWRRRMELTLNLAPRAGEEAGYRHAVFEGVLRRHGLGDLAEDRELVAEIASRTDPGPLGGRALRSPFDLLRPGSGGPVQSVRLVTPADIEAWTSESLLLLASNGDPRRADFWRDILEQSLMEA